MDGEDRKKLELQLRECRQILRIGPGGDICSYLQHKKRAVILGLLVGLMPTLRICPYSACNRLSSSISGHAGEKWVANNSYTSTDAGG